MNQLKEILANPSQYFKTVDGYPPKHSGNLLAWLINELEGYTINDIFYIESSLYQYYKFDPNVFNIPITNKWGDIKELSKIHRFVMTDRSTFTVENSDGEYTSSRLTYASPVKTPDILLDGFDLLAE